MLKRGKRRRRPPAWRPRLFGRHGKTAVLLLTPHVALALTGERERGGVGPGRSRQYAATKSAHTHARMLQVSGAGLESINKCASSNSGTTCADGKKAAVMFRRSKSQALVDDDDDDDDDDDVSWQRRHSHKDKHGDGEEEEEEEEEEVVTVVSKEAKVKKKTTPPKTERKDKKASSSKDDKDFLLSAETRPGRGEKAEWHKEKAEKALCFWESVTMAMRHVSPGKKTAGRATPQSAKDEHPEKGRRPRPPPADPSRYANLPHCDGPAAAAAAALPWTSRAKVKLAAIGRMRTSRAVRADGSWEGLQ
ncbi:uncharacterized protein LOC144010806 [Festucalex cinctus]